MYNVISQYRHNGTKRDDIWEYIHKIVCVFPYTRMTYGFVRIYFVFIFLRRQGYRMITFDRQAGPFQNFGRSQVMVIGRRVSSSDPRDPRVGSWAAPKSPPPPNFCLCVSEPQDIFEKNKIAPPPRPFFLRFRTQGTFFLVNQNVSPSPLSSPLRPRPALRTLVQY